MTESDRFELFFVRFREKHGGRIDADTIEQIHDDLLGSAEGNSEDEWEELARALLDEGGDRQKVAKRLRDESRDYTRDLRHLQAELVKLQDWVVETGKKVVVLFEGRDAAGKGGVIKAITQRLNPRVVRVVALNKPTNEERSQWYFQRYVKHLPSAGQIVLFDRSWYNRAGVERVMGFASGNEVDEFFRTVPQFEDMLIGSGIELIKYWFSVSDEEQEFRFECRILDPLKQWKLSPMDLESRVRWEDYTRAKEEMLEKTSTENSPWHVVAANDKRKSRLNCIDHLLSRFDYEEIERDDVVLPERRRNQGYRRLTTPPGMLVPEKY